MVEDGIEKRGNIYYIRRRVPACYRAVEPRIEINTSLRTDSLTEARSRLAILWRTFVRDWDAQVLGRDAPGSREAFDGAMGLLRDLNLPYQRVDRLATGPLEDLVLRLEKIADRSAGSPAVPAALGGLDLPMTLVSEMPREYERVRADHVAAKNGRQLREWRNKYIRASSAFIECVGDKPMPEVTTQDGRAYRRHWETKRDRDKIETTYVNKQITYMKQMVDAFYSDLGLMQADYENPFVGLSLEKTGAEARRTPGSKMALPVPWITEVLLNREKTAELDPQARDIAIVCAETGAREAEVFDLPPDDIVLEHPIPHLRLDIIDEGEHRRELKNLGSKRLVPLLGHGLDAMRRNPQGFPNYRGNAGFYAIINNYFRNRDLFPSLVEGARRKPSIGGLRHAFEDRMKWAHIENEERALLMGHSLKSLRGRPVYGAQVELRLRALLLEMIALPTPTWSPRCHDELSCEINRILEEHGFRRN